MAMNYPPLKSVQGFSWMGVNIGIKDESLDFGVIASNVKCAAAGVFTRNNFPGAPIIVGRENLVNGMLQAVVVNSKTPAPTPSEETEIPLSLTGGATIAVAPAAAVDLVACISLLPAIIFLLNIVCVGRSPH